MPGYNIQSLFRVLPQHTVALRCAKALELPQNGFLRGNQASATGTSKAEDDAKTRESNAPKADPGPTPVSIAGPGICGRTPEIQNKLISELHIASCRAINDAELYRIRKISFDTESIKPGDLTGFVNLKELSISGLNEPITPGVFAGLKSLTSLGIITNEPITPGVFAGLESLTTLYIGMNLPEEKTATFGAGAFQGMPELEVIGIGNNNEKALLLFGENAFQGINHLKVLNVGGYASIENGTFRGSGQIDEIMFESLESMPNGGLDGLSVKTMEIKKTKRIFPGSLDGLQNIQYLSISADSSGDVKPRISRSLFSELEELRGVSMKGFRWPEEIELNNLQVVCGIKSKNNNWGNKVDIIVDSEKVEYLTAEKAGENKKICKIAIGDQIKEILIRHDEE